MFLPYYVAQDYGWVLALKSFRGLDFYRNFKNDYYDYYLGITNEFDRLEKQKLEKEKKDLESSIKFLTDVEQQNDELNLSVLKDELFISKSNEYLDSYKKHKAELIINEKDFLIKCNELTFCEERLKILNKINSSLKKEDPLKNDCPTCKQNLPSSLENIYEYSQDVNNTIEEIKKIKDKVKALQSSINSLDEDIRDLKEKVSKDYSVLIKYKIEDLTFGTWLDNKTNVKLSENISTKIGEATILLNKKIDELSKFKTDDEIINTRETKYSRFNDYFLHYIKELDIKEFEDYKYTKLLMGSFPKQGVELLKTMLAYYFALNRVVKETEYVHRFPFLLDAIFKEDIDEDNREMILKFIYRNKPKNEQIFFSFAESTKNPKTAKEYNNELMKNEAKLILTDLTEERSILKSLNVEQDEYLKETLNLIE